jgi:hypothetical protein
VRGIGGLIAELLRVEGGALRGVAEPECRARELIAVAQPGAVLVDRVALDPFRRVRRGIAGGGDALHVGTKRRFRLSGGCGHGTQGGAQRECASETTGIHGLSNNGAGREKLSAD